MNKNFLILKKKKKKRIAAAPTADGVIGVLVEVVVLLSRTQSWNGNKELVL